MAPVPFLVLRDVLILLPVLLPAYIRTQTVECKWFNAVCVTNIFTILSPPQFFTVTPDVKSIARGLFVPGCSNCDQQATLQAVGIIGAIIMPHNLYLHSALVKVSFISPRGKKESISPSMIYLTATVCSVL